VFQFRASGIDRPPWKPPFLYSKAGQPKLFVLGWDITTFSEIQRLAIWRQFYYGNLVPKVDRFAEMAARHRERAIAAILLGGQRVGGGKPTNRERRRQRRRRVR